MTKPNRALNILFVSHTYIGGPFVVGSHHLARELSRMGHRVLHLSTPITPAHLLRWKRRSIRDRVGQWRGRGKTAAPDGMLHWVPLALVPWNLSRRIYRSTGVNLFLRSIVLPRIDKLLAARRFSEIDLMFIDQPYFAGIEKLLKAKTIIYRPTDHYAEMLGDPTVESAEKQIASSAHGVVATSEPVLRCVRRHNRELPAIVLENGVEFAHFEKRRPEPEDLRPLPRRRAIYAGAVDDRFDMAAVKRLAESCPELGVVVIGPFDPAAVRTFSFPPNAFFLGARSYDELPAYLQHADVALLPLSDHKANRGRSPMKLYEYASAGLPAVVRKTPELERRGEEFLYFYEDKDSLAAKVREVLERLDRGEIDKRKIVEAGRRQSWTSKAERLVEFSSGLGEAMEERAEGRSESARAEPALSNGG